MGHEFVYIFWHKRDYLFLKWKCWISNFYLVIYFTVHLSQLLWICPHVCQEVMILIEKE